MARFVERQIDQMEKRFSCVVGFERREDKRPAPPEQQQKYRNSSGERDRVGRRIRLNEPFFGQGHPASAIPQRRLSLQWSKRPILRKNDSALHTFCCSIRLISLTLGTEGYGNGRGCHIDMVGPSLRSDKKISGLIQTVAREARDWRERRDVQAMIPSVSPLPPVPPVSRVTVSGRRKEQAQR